MPRRRMPRDVRSVAAMALAALRRPGRDEATIRREATALATRAIARNVPDPWEQETWQAAVERAIDEAIAEGRRR